MMVSKTEFTPDWKDWIKTNVDAGQDRDGIFKILLDEGYDPNAIAGEMNYLPTRPLGQLENPFHAANAQRAAASKQGKASRSHILDSQNKQPSQFERNNGMPISREQVFVPNGKAHSSDTIDLCTVDNFLSAQECADLITNIKSKLRPSSVGSFEVDTRFRTSRTCDLGRIDDPLVSDIDARICKLIGIDPAYAEVTQGQYYEVGQEFKAHTDYFEPNEFDLHCSERGQRTYTVMVYLNDVEQGGETCFDRVGAAFKPAAGMAVIWNSLNPDGTPNPYTLHQAKPVEKGVKAVITKWFRSLPPQSQGVKMFKREINEYVPNYTASGIHKAKLPEALFAKVNAFYHDNRQSQTDEHVDGGFIFDGTEAKQKRPTSSSLINLTPELRQEIHDALKPMMASWCEQELESTFVYGIREYHNGAVLKMHRDRVDTHIISAIINVDQETDVDWPLVIEDNYYRTHHVMIKPGEMIFYEGGRLKHGRPIMFEGQAFANLFCHFKPVGYVAPQ